MTRYYGQFNLDKFLHETYFLNTREKVAIECGAFDGLMESTCKFFEESMDWTTINIEAYPPLYKKLVINRPNSINICKGLHNDKTVTNFTHVIHPELKDHFGNGSLQHVDEHKQQLINIGCTFVESPIETDTYSNIIDPIMLNLNKNTVDLFVLDVEGNELQVIEGMQDTKYKPRIICVEYPQSGLDNITNMLNPMGYTFDMLHHHNAIFILK